MQYPCVELVGHFLGLFPQPLKLRVVVASRALPDDPDITATLRRHQVHRPGPDWRPSTPFESYAPLPLHPGLLHSLYVDIGLAVDHIEMLCGVGAVTVRTALAQAGIPTRSYGQPCPWNQRRHTKSRPDLL